MKSARPFYSGLVTPVPSLINNPVSMGAGEHHLCVKGQLPLWKGLSLHQLNAKPGETYYFFVHVVSGGRYDELTLTQLDPDEGKELVARSKFHFVAGKVSTFTDLGTSRNLSGFR